MHFANSIINNRKYIKMDKKNYKIFSSVSDLSEES